jgi:hypothetical protein
MSESVWPEPIVSELTIEFVQDCDCVDDDKKKLGYQRLQVKWEDGGGGLFPIWKTDRFAFDGLDNDVDKLLEGIHKLITEYNDNHEKK